MGTKYNNPTTCLNPPKFVKQLCKQCKFFERCTFERKLIGYKGGKPILYRDIKEDEECLVTDRRI